MRIASSMQYSSERSRSGFHSRRRSGSEKNKMSLSHISPHAAPATVSASVFAAVCGFGLCLSILKSRAHPADFIISMLQWSRMEEER